MQMRAERGAALVNMNNEFNSLTLLCGKTFFSAPTQCHFRGQPSHFVCSKTSQLKITAKIWLQKPIRCFIPPPPSSNQSDVALLFLFWGCWGARGSSVTFQGVNAPQENPLGADPPTTP